MEDPLEDDVDRLRGTVEDAIRQACSSTLVLSQDLLDRISGEISSLSEDEPCGLRGAVLTVLWAEEGRCEELAQVKADPNMPTTHHLLLTLRPDNPAWYARVARVLR